MSLDQKDLELIERIVYKNSDDTAILIDRAIERFGERLNDTETRVYSRMADIEEKTDDAKQNSIDMFEKLHEDIRELIRVEI